MRYSESFYKFMEPAIKDIKSTELLEKTLNWGQSVWNKAIVDAFPDKIDEENFNTLYILFEKSFHDKKLISKFLKRKKSFFSNDNFFIKEQNFQINDDGNLIITVSAIDV